MKITLHRRGALWTANQGLPVPPQLAEWLSRHAETDGPHTLRVTGGLHAELTNLPDDVAAAVAIAWTDRIKAELLGLVAG